MIKFDTDTFRLELERCSAQQLLAISAASAQRTFAVIERRTDHLGVKRVEALSGLIDKLWKSMSSEVVISPNDRDLAEKLVPDDEGGDWSPATAYLQNAAAATTFALDVALEGRVQDAFWSVTQVPELAYFEALRQDPDLDLNTERGRVAALSTEVVQVSISGIRADVQAVANGASASELRARVIGDSIIWALLFTG